MAIKRIELLGVPVDILQPEELEMTVLELLARPGTKQIIFLSIWDLLKARHRGEFQDCVKNADLVLPISKSIIRGANFLKKNVPVRYNPFTTVINVMSVLDNHYKSLYLLGSHKQTMLMAEQNVKDTFPNLRIVGRYNGYYNKAMEPNIIQSIYKTSPALVLLSDGVKDKNCWAFKRRNQFASSIFMYYKDALGIFSKRIKRVSEETFDKGHEVFHEVIKNPLKIFLIFPYAKYILSLVWCRLFNND
ncbi:MAG: WecB/TagA/CpsF family glycosyltransferase [Treponema sp.]|nr:WecB/TagA/CpsF family glycosyltransferase [Treponema sp.]